MRIRRCVFLACVTAVVVATALEGCGGGGTTTTGDACVATPACSRAVAPTPAEQQACTATANDPTCGSLFRTMKECQTFYARCTSSGSFSSSATNAYCKDSVTAYTACRGDAGVDAGCRLRTCSQAGANCGEIDNGCGTKIACGACTNGQNCIVNATTGVGRCGCQCDPTWCGTLTACNTTVTCPTNCVAPQFCGGGGIANRCGCSPSGALGPLTATSMTTATIAVEAGTTPNWSSPTNARVSDNSVATAPMTVGATTQYLVALSFNASVPAGATIAGITVQVERASTAGLATADNAVYLVKGTTIQVAGENKAAAGAWPVTETTATYGGPTDLWGNTWTVADVNAGGFGVAFSATYTGVNGNESARVDSIRVTVHFTGVPCN